MPYYSRIILNSFYNRLFPKLFRHNRRMPTEVTVKVLQPSQLHTVLEHQPATSFSVLELYISNPIAFVVPYQVRPYFERFQPMSQMS